MMNLLSTQSVLLNSSDGKRATRHSGANSVMCKFKSNGGHRSKLFTAIDMTWRQNISQLFPTSNLRVIGLALTLDSTVSMVMCR